MHQYVNMITSEFEKFSNSENAVQMEKYMRNKFKYYGLKTLIRKEIISHFIKQNGLPQISELEIVVTDLWNAEYRELQYFALVILDKIIKKADIGFISFIEFLILNKSWWDSIDFIAPNLVRTHFERYPELIPEYTNSWINSENIWLQRSAILFQLNKKKDTDIELMFKLILTRKNSREFFVQKAMGWILRQYAKTNSEIVINFVKINPELPELTKREALKHFQV